MNLRFSALLPARLWAGLFVAAPLAIVCGYSFLTRGDYGGVDQPWTGESYTRLADPLYLAILWRSVWIASIATVCCALLGFPLALFIARAGRYKNLFLQLVLLPFWTSFLVRTYAWLFILRDTGLINTVLLRLHLIHAPLQLLYNDAAVLLGLVYNFLPFFVLPVYATLERLDPALLEASADLGARPFSTLRRVIAAALRPGHCRRMRAGFHSLPGSLPDARSAGRRQDRHAGESDSEPVHYGAGLAVWVRRVASAFAGQRSFAACDRSKPRRKGSPVKGPTVKQPLAIYVALALAFLHAPLLVLIVFSFNSSRFTIWEGFSLRWYRAAFQDPQLAEGLMNSLLIAFAAAAVASVIGTAAAYGMWRRPARCLSGTLYLSLVTPEIVTGVSLAGTLPGRIPVPASAPGAIHSDRRPCGILDRVCRLSWSLRACAITTELWKKLPWIWGPPNGVPSSRVTLPAIAPAIAAGFLLALVVSFDDYVITSLVAGVDSETLPMVIYAMARRGVSPVVNAVSALIVVAFGFLILLSQRLQKT